MDDEGIECVVIAEPLLELVAGKEGNEASSQADNHRARGVDKTAGGCDHDETGDCTRTETKDAGLALKNIFGHGPDEGGNGGRKSGGGKCVGCNTVCRHGTA